MNFQFSFNPFATPIFLTSLLFVILAFFSFNKNNKHGTGLITRPPIDANYI
jgi:hypothetical protein